MKKIFSFIAGVAAAMTLQAASYTEAVQITMSGTGDTESQKLTLIVDQDQATVATNPNIASTYEVGQVNIYVANGSYKYDEYVANAISNLPLTIVTNRRDASYTFTFNAPIITDGLTLTDLRSNEGVKTMPIIHNGSYTFTVGEADGYEANKNITIADRFVINYVAPAPTGYNVTLNGAGLATFSAAETTKIPDGLKVYQAGNIANDELVLNQVEDDDYIPANTGVILYGDADQSYFMEIYNDIVAISEDYTSNSLKAYTAWESRSAEPVYILHGSELWQYTGTQFVDNKAFLQLPGGANNAPARISMRFNTTTAVENVETEAVKAVKFVGEDGQLYIRRGNEVYNLQGQLVK